MASPDGGDILKTVGLGLSVGTALAQTGTVVLSNSNSVSFGIATYASGVIVTMSASGGGLTAAIQSISAGSTRITSGQAVFSPSGGISFGANGQTITAGFSKVSSWDNRLGLIKDDIQLMQAGILHINALHFDNPIDATRADFVGHLSVVGSASGSYSVSFGLYTLNGSTASLASSALLSASWNSGSTTSAASIYGGQSDFRWRSVTLGTWAITPGEYILASVLSTGGDTNSIPRFRFAGAESNPLWFPEAEQVVAPYWGPWRFQASTTNALPASMVLSSFSLVNQSTAYMRLMGTY